MPDSHDIDQIIEDLKTIQEQFATKLEELTLARGQAQIDDELERSYKAAGDILLFLVRPSPDHLLI